MISADPKEPDNKTMNNVDILTLSNEAKLHARAILFSLPRELNGITLSAIDDTLSAYEGDNSASFIEQWYRSADVASYDSTAAAAAYLGAYGPRSILKYQEALFALLVTKEMLPRHIRIIDYGAGPCVGFGALIDLLGILTKYTGESLAMDYIAVDRSEYMLEVGEYFCRRLKEKTQIQTSYELHHLRDYTYDAAHMLIIANVMNDGEGNLDCHQLLNPLVEVIQNLEDIIVIEPATEQPSTQLCGLTKHMRSFVHVGPCASGEATCTEWSFRQFYKRVYSCERRCLGQWASAAQVCKYSLALLSSVSSPRMLSEEERVVVGQPSSAGWAMTCRHGQKQPMRVTSQATPWDTVDRNGKLIRWWP